MPTLLFYHIILQHPIYQMFYNSILYIKIILLHSKIIFTTHQHNKPTTNNIPHIFRTVANLPQYCLVLQKKNNIPHLLNWLKLGLVWDTCQIFSIWHISHIYCGCSYPWKLFFPLLLQLSTLNYSTTCHVYHKFHNLSNNTLIWE